MVDMDDDRCRGCGDPRRMGTVLSAHRTSEGTVVYDRCRCGRAGVRLLATAGAVVAHRSAIDSAADPGVVRPLVDSRA